MNRRPREFVVTDAIRSRTPVVLTFTGPSGTGKTYSAHRIAKGMEPILGGPIGMIDTEGGRGLHYADLCAWHPGETSSICKLCEREKRERKKLFTYKYVDFAPPYGPLDYKDAVAKLVAMGCKIIIVDQMTYEHSGEGGVMDQIDSWLEEKCGDDFEYRQKLNMIAHARIKPQRKELNNYLVGLGRQGITLLLCYRARDVVKPLTKEEKAAAKEAKGRGEDREGIKHLGLQPETTSNLIYETTLGFLLRPGAAGRPTTITAATTDEEKSIAKTPAQFLGWVTGAPLDEALGEKLARWALGVEATASNQPTDARAKAIAHFAALGIDEARVLAAAGGGDVVALGRQWAKDIKAGRKLEDIFPPPAAPAAEATREPGDDDTAGGALTAAELEEMQREDEGGRP